MTTVQSNFDGISNICDRILYIASLFNGAFYVDWIIELTGIKARDILAIMEDGLQTGLLVKKGPGMFCFKDKSQQERLQNNESDSDKKRLIRDITNILLREPITDSETVQTVSNHLLNVKNNIEGCRWLLQVADEYRKSYEYNKALPCYKKVIKDLGSLEIEEADDLYVNAALGYSRISDMEKRTETVTSALNTALKKSKKIGNDRLLALLEMNLAKTKWFRSDWKNANKHFEKGMSIVEKIDDPRLRKSAAAFTNIFLYQQGRFKEVIQNVEKTTPDVSHYPKSPLSVQSSWATGIAYGFTGDITHGMGILDSLYNHYAQKGDLYTESLLAYGIGALLFEINRIEESLEYFKEAQIKAMESNNQLCNVNCLQIMALIYNIQKDSEKAVHYFKDAISLCHKMKYDPAEIFILLFTFCMMEKGEFPLVPGFSYSTLMKGALNGKSFISKGIARRYQSITLKKNGASHTQVTQSLLEAIKWFEKSGFKTQLAQVKVDLAFEYLSAGKENKAAETIKSLTSTLLTFGDHLVPEELKLFQRELIDEKNLLAEILTLSQEIVTLRDPKELAGHIISKANSLTGAERGAIFLLDKENSACVPVLKASRNLALEDITQPDFKNSMQMIQETFVSEEGMILTEDTPETVDIRGRATIRNCICVPMKIRDKVTGALYHDNRFFKSSFKKEDLSIFSYFASQAAIAMDNAIAYEKIQAHNEALSLEKQYFETQQVENFFFEDIIGNSNAIKEVLAMVAHVADTDTNVLILGETGVGKELVARAVHRNSRRKNDPFIGVNCSALERTLIASELFGHEKGAFTNAVEQRIGRFEMANKGTIFLDEIGDIPLDVQVRLLRVLQNKELERVGGRETIHTDFRLIAATNRDLFQAVKEKSFREDLYYRLNVFPIHIPPLRKRKEDIPLMIYYFLKKYAKKSGKEVNITKMDVEKLVGYDWPGNVRELENIVERGLILSSSSRFKMPEFQREYNDALTNDHIKTFREMEIEHINQALHFSKGKIRGKDGAAKMLDINASTLYGKMRKLGIN